MLSKEVVYQGYKSNTWKNPYTCVTFKEKPRGRESTIKHTVKTICRNLSVAEAHEDQRGSSLSNPTAVNLS